ncbi:cation-transporting P-type ATPase, partial [Streptomyces sp. NPDC006208]|uniref:cation-translocating P-type ATPase n=1 Tax=Streptomyces sp. NPDC006208 TaxID=3156734 RepID=UPI0033B72CE7
MTPRPVQTTPTGDEHPAGLTEQEAARRLFEYGRNEVAARRAVRMHTRVLAQLRDPLIMVLLGAVVLTVAIGDHADSVVIALVIVVNTTVGVIQEIRADNAVAALSAMSAPSARVLRDGTDREVPATEVVPGDVLLLGEGDIVPADARLMEASALLVDESMLTGESVPVDKDLRSELPEAATLSAGTVVVRGRGVAEVTATGAASALGRIAALLVGRLEPTPLQRRLASLGRVLAVVTLALCVLVFGLGLLRGQGLGTMAVTAISLAVAAVPESLPAVVTLALALGARRMAARHAVVRRLPAVETLGSVTVLGADKTGTLTEGRMVVEHVWTPGGAVDFTGVGYEPTGETRVGGRMATAAELVPVQEVLTVAALCNDATLRPPPAEAEHDERWTASGDPTEAALLTAAAKVGCADHHVLRQRYPRTAEEPFDSMRKRMTTLHMTPSGHVMVCLKGAPEAVVQETVLDESADRLEGVRQEAARLAAQGYRVLAVASALRDDPLVHVADAETHLRLLGLVALNDPPKAAATATLASCRAAGITPVLITGDHPATARAIAARVGLLDAGSEARDVVTGPALASGAVG